MYTFRANEDVTFDEFPLKELKLIDLTIRMFTEPTLEVDVPLLEEHLIRIRENKANLLRDADIDLKDVMSNTRFAQILSRLDVAPPTKTSPNTGKQTYAFAKTDQGLQDLLEHPDLRVQAVVAARLGVKTTIEESRTERFIGIGKRGPLPVPLKYYAAHTGRWGGSDKLNMQNLPSRGNASALKKSLRAPAGHVIISCDSSQIEARTLAWVAGQEDLVTAFANGEDVYKIMASKIYHTPVTEVTKEQRFFGKTVILGCGYGMGAEKFHHMLSLTKGTKITMGEAERIIAVYRGVNPKIVRFWKYADRAIHYMATSTGWTFGRGDLLEVGNKYVTLPNTMKIEYNDLRSSPSEGWMYSTLREKNVKLYGGKLVENVVQALARIIVGEQMLKIAKKYRPVLTVHDAVSIIVPEQESTEAMAYVQECMRWVPKWAEGLPVDCEIGCGPTYADS
jgi:DNA polymerase